MDFFHFEVCREALDENSQLVQGHSLVVVDITSVKYLDIRNIFLLQSHNHLEQALLLECVMQYRAIHGLMFLASHPVCLESIIEFLKRYHSLDVLIQYHYQSTHLSLGQLNVQGLQVLFERGHCDALGVVGVTNPEEGLRCKLLGF